ncbi:uncharacterized protein LOC132267196 [Cornus florida]|uniref:uncharacterized protein LOC132267196 n=1 Tax=Cornus florida TaxID=4283 RepID=UPI00289E4D1B|nr:uncharacterized protein LOC132267196 [Cornus florida]
MRYCFALIRKPSYFYFLLHNRNPRKTLTLRPTSMDWTCSKCTFINPPSQKSTCQICLSSTPQPPLLASSSPSSSSSSPPTPKWSCKACTFLNPYRNTNCEICGTRASASSLTSLEDDELDDPCVGSVFLPLQPCKRKIREQQIEPVDDTKRKNREQQIEVVDDIVELSGFRDIKSSNKAVKLSGETYSGADIRSLKILSYNVWFREDLEMHKRMKALGDLIQLHSPDLICFQEVTSNIYDIFQQSSWWKVYSCSVSSEMAFTRPYFCMQLSKLPVKSYNCKPFRNSAMGRELCVAEVEVQTDMPLVVGTSHLESPCPGPPKWDQMYSKERVDQAKEALNFLKKNPNVIFCGDMNWDDRLDGQYPLPDGWIDAWLKLRPAENGWTYDTKSNKMLTGNRTLQKRLDRFLCNLHDFKITGIDMIGMEAIPGVSYCKEKKMKKEVQKLVLPVLPSDHYGLLLTIHPL